MNHVDYETSIRRSLWAWADQYHRGELDGGKRDGRSPVLEKQFADKNVLVPTNVAKAHKITRALPIRQRHRWFCSLRSSQALTQSVFGAFYGLNRLDLFSNIMADCGRPAFLAESDEARIDFEYEVDNLREPRRTSIDVMMRRLQHRVAIECKFTEQEFGICSRPMLTSKEKNYPQQYCNGNYQFQQGRSKRCALTSIDIQYWRYIPRLFGWSDAQDHLPCPVRHTYQLIRNALAATVNEDGRIDCDGRHVLIVYDARNPAFLPDGKAAKQYAIASKACRIPGLFRQISWQRILAATTHASEFSFLLDAAEVKYGLKPE
ncbi:MAG: hypothetical protein OXC68_07450 [Aestuariivita sp.]|nr:hypothetical protein [Aestuariivita sp.]